MATASDVMRIATNEIGTDTGRKYWDWYWGGSWGYVDGGSTPWCACFVSWCLAQAGVNCEGFPRAVAIDPRDGFARLIEAQNMEYGDPVGFDWDGDTTGDHIGFFEKWVEKGYSFYAIEGNTGNGVVARKLRYVSQVTCAVRPFYESEPKPCQEPGEPKNDVGMCYRAHSQDLGWLPAVRDGQTSGVTARSLRCEAIKVTPPEGVVLDAFAHVQNVGTLGFPGIYKGKGSGTSSSDNDPIIGTTGRSLRLEAVMFRCVENKTGKSLKVQAHVQDEGWQEPVGEGEWAGTRGEGKRLEAIRMWFE